MQLLHLSRHYLNDVNIQEIWVKGEKHACLWITVLASFSFLLALVILQGTVARRLFKGNQLLQGLITKVVCFAIGKISKHLSFQTSQNSYSHFRQLTILTSGHLAIIAQHLKSLSKVMGTSLSSILNTSRMGLIWSPCQTPLMLDIRLLINSFMLPFSMCPKLPSISLGF